MSAFQSLSRAHAHAIYDLLAPVSAPPYNRQRYFAKVNVSDSELTYPHLIVWPQPATRSQVNLTGTLYDATTTTAITVVGRDDDEVLAVGDLVGELLQGKKPSIEGRIPGQIRNVPSSQPVRETDQSRTPDGQPYYMAVSYYSLNSTAAPATP